MTPSEIRSLRERLKLSREEFASSLGVSKWTVRSWELGERNPRDIAIKVMKEVPNA